MKNVITYHNSERFHEGIVALTKAGLTFTADAGDFTITLTGGY